MNVGELKELLKQYPDDYPIMEGLEPSAATDCTIEKVSDTDQHGIDNSFLLIIPFV